MGNRIVHQGRRYSPLPIRDGLNATRVRVSAEGINAWDFVWNLIVTQRHRHPADDESALHQRFQDGLVLLRDGTRLTPSTLLRAGQDVYFYRTPAPEVAVPFDIPIVYEDDTILVVDKPPFLATMPRARHITETATVKLRRSTGNSELSPAHRLDRLTSGLLLFTKTRSARGAYQTMFAQRKVAKTYLAIAPFQAFETPLTWRSRMEKVPGEIQGSIVPGEPNAVTILHAISPLSALAQSQLDAIHGPQPALAQYTLKPETGKTHQLRLHMWQAGVPILGDPVYPHILPAAAEDFSIPMHLTAHALAFTDPLTGAERYFETPPRLIPA